MKTEAIERLINAVDVWVACGVFKNTNFSPETDEVKEELKAINVMQSSLLLKDKKITDLLNWVKSDIGQEVNPKLGKTSTPYRREKMRFLYKIEEMLNL